MKMGKIFIREGREETRRKTCETDESSVIRPAQTAFAFLRVSFAPFADKTGFQNAFL